MSQFKKSFFGYKVAEVDAKILSLRNEADDLRKVISDHETKLKDLNTRNQKYKDQILNVSSALVDAKEMARIIVERAKTEADMILDDANARSNQAWSLMYKQLNDFEKIKNNIVEYEGTMKLEALQVMNTYAEKIKEIDFEKHQERYTRALEHILDSGKYQLDELQKVLDATTGNVKEDLVRQSESEKSVSEVAASEVKVSEISESTAFVSEVVEVSEKEIESATSVSETSESKVTSVSESKVSEISETEAASVSEERVSEVSESASSVATSLSTSPTLAQFLAASVSTSASAVSERAQSLIDSVSEVTPTSVVKESQSIQTSLVSSETPEPVKSTQQESETTVVEEDAIPIVTFWED